MVVTKKRRVVSSELRLAALLSRPHLNVSLIASAAKLLVNIDVDRLHTLVIQHRVWPCVYCNVRDYFPNLLPDSSFDYLKIRYQKTVLQNERSFALCGKLLRDAKEHGVNLKVLKGMPLAFTLYGDISKRQSSDIDLVVKAADLDAAHAILTREGFQADRFSGLSENLKVFYWSTRKDITYLDKSGTYIELHTRLSLSKTQVNDKYLNALFNVNIVDNIAHLEHIYLCWHGMHTLFHRLKWLVDIALYLESQSDESKLQLVILAKDLEAFRLLSASWVLAHQLFDTDIPQEVLHFYQQDVLCRTVVCQCLKRLHNTQVRKSLGFGLASTAYAWLLYQNKKEGFAFLIQNFKPTETDLTWIGGLPDRLYFLLYLLRPVRVICLSFKHHCAAAIRRLTGKWKNT